MTGAARVSGTNSDVGHEEEANTVLLLLLLLLSGLLLPPDKDRTCAPDAAAHTPRVCVRGAVAQTRQERTEGAPVSVCSSPSERPLGCWLRADASGECLNLGSGNSALAARVAFLDIFRRGASVSQSDAADADGAEARRPGQQRAAARLSVRSFDIFQLEVFVLRSAPTSRGSRLATGFFPHPLTSFFPTFGLFFFLPGGWNLFVSSRGARSRSSEDAGDLRTATSLLLSPFLPPPPRFGRNRLPGPSSFFPVLRV